MNTKALLAVFKRNFVAYFANPTGYLFICAFVGLSTVTAFWPNEFFNTNLANLDQLSFSPANALRSFPFIMLVFIPAISMSVWADERRQGTDELLLTIPATDLVIVLGKYLAALAIFSVSLLFSLVCNFTVLRFLGNPDPGLFLGTYFGYWLIGLAMLAVGTAASFLTSNLTIAYVMGAAMNLPLAFAAFADNIVGRTVALAVKEWSITERFRDFGNGILSLSSLTYFLGIGAIFLYLSMILIARRHWIRGQEASVMALHYTVRVVAISIALLAAVLFFTQRDVRLDVTSEQLSSLSAETKKLIRDLDPEQPVQIEAFISPSVPEEFIQTRRNLISTLRELDRRGGSRIRVRVHNTERFSDEASLAAKRFDISPRRVMSIDRGAHTQEHVFMGVAFRSGLEKVVLPFIGRGIPVEYELVRSIATVTQQKRQTVGILQTDAPLYGQFNMQTMAPPRNWPIIAELEKQYEVKRVNASSPIDDDLDVLLAVQPSSLGPEQMNHFVDALERGIPTAIFEDPLPAFAGSVPGTTADRRAPGGGNPMMRGRQPPPEKAERTALWDLLKVDFSETKIVWQNYNPHPTLTELQEEFVFVGEGSGIRQPFNAADPITSGLQHMMFPFPGSLRNRNVSKLKFTPLVKTGPRTGSVRSEDTLRMSMFGAEINPDREQIPTGVNYVLAAHIQGKVPAGSAPRADDHDGHDHGNGNGNGNGNGDAGDAGDAESSEPKHTEGELNVVLVADIDMFTEQFFRLREQGNIPQSGVHFDFDNVTFVLNVLDRLAGDDRFIEIRKRRPKHRTLTRIEERAEEARKENTQVKNDLRKEFEKAQKEEEDRLKRRIAKIQEDMEKAGGLPMNEIFNRVGVAQADGERRMEAKLEQLKQETDHEINRIEKDLRLKIRQLQDFYKLWAVLLPPIPPLLVAGFVFFDRRRREREGVSRTRLRS